MASAQNLEGHSARRETFFLIIPEIYSKVGTPKYDNEQKEEHAKQI